MYFQEAILALVEVLEPGRSMAPAGGSGIDSFSGPADPSCLGMNWLKQLLRCLQKPQKRPLLPLSCGSRAWSHVPAPASRAGLAVVQGNGPLNGHSAVGFGTNFPTSSKLKAFLTLLRLGEDHWKYIT